MGSSFGNPEILGSALKSAFFKLDENLREYQANHATDTSGCTSCVCVITPKYIICANAGDSRSVLGNANAVVPMSEDHKPNNPVELQRIKSAGGIVEWNRVDGDLAVSRAFGDFQFKQRNDLPAEAQKVSPSPDIKIYDRNSNDEILILACDGLWDVMSNDEAVQLAREIMGDGESDASLLAEEMIDIALDKGTIKLSILYIYYYYLLIITFLLFIK